MTLLNTDEDLRSCSCVNKQVRCEQKSPETAEILFFVLRFSAARPTFTQQA